MSVARSASATTSLPKPAALIPAGAGRSRSPRPGPAGRLLTGSTLLLDTAASAFAPRANERHPTGLRALTQSGEQFQAGIAVGRLHSDLLLKGDDGPDRIGTGASVNPIGPEAMLIETSLNLLDLLQGRGALAAGKLLAEGRVTPDQVAKMAKRQRVTR